jgi:predicted secreted Zn-dependent protease
VICCCVAFVCPSSVWAADRICSYVPPELSQMREEGVQIDYYYLSSSTSAGLIEELRTNGPRNEVGRRFDAFFSWYIGWRWPVWKRDGRTFPEYSKLSFQKTLRLQFPCWQPRQERVRGYALKQWQIFVQKLARHEMKHYQIFREGEGKLIRAVIRLTSRKVATAPEVVNTEGHKILEEIRTADAEYDAATTHGRNEGITYELLSF